MRRALFSFWAIGAALAASSVAGLVWQGLTNPLDWSHLVRLGSGGIMAVGLVWAARAQTATRAAMRWTSLMAVLIVATVAAFVTSALLDGDDVHLLGIDFSSTLGRRDAFAPVNEFFVDVTVSTSTVGVAVLALLPVWGIVARAAARARPGRRRLLLMFAAAVPLLWEVVARTGDGAEVAALIAAVGLFWLVWALLRAAPAEPTLVE